LFDCMHEVASSIEIICEGVVYIEICKVEASIAIASLVYVYSVSRYHPTSRYPN
jgi:hypothetical protein